MYIYARGYRATDMSSLMGEYVWRIASAFGMSAKSVYLRSLINNCNGFNVDAGYIILKII